MNITDGAIPEGEAGNGRLERKKELAKPPFTLHGFFWVLPITASRNTPLRPHWPIAPEEDISHLSAKKPAAQQTADVPAARQMEPHPLCSSVIL